jgi:integrase
VNRTANGLKAALNLMAEHDEAIPNRRAWENGLASLHDAEESRNVILAEPAIRTIIEKANEHSAEFGLLVEVAAVTGARVSQLSRLEVQDLQDDRTDPRLMMPSSRKGRGTKKSVRRPVPIPAGLAAKLRGIVKGRPVNAALLVKPVSETQNPSGEEPVTHSLVPWRKSDHSRPFARTVEAAGLNPDEVTINALRHSSIVRQLLAGVSGSGCRGKSRHEHRHDRANLFPPHRRPRRLARSRGGMVLLLRRSGRKPAYRAGGAPAHMYCGPSKRFAHNPIRTSFYRGF